MKKGKKQVKKSTETSISPRNSIAEKYAGYINLLIKIGVWAFPIYLSINAYSTWGVNFFIPTSWRDLGYSPQEWQKILINHTVVFLGGPHRGGTTVLWDALRPHPDISSFGSQRESGFDLSEGIFVQNVYPSFGIGYEKFRRADEHTGLGRFALSKEEDVHWTGQHPKVTPKNQARLLNRFGWYWDLGKPILLEKSPSNAVLSSFLQELLNIGNSGWSSTVEGFGSKPSVAKFIFITRHPLANSYAHKRLDGLAHEKFATLLENWIKVHEYLQEDMHKLQFVKVVRLEDFEANPTAYITEFWKWMGITDGIDSYVAEAVSLVRPNQNAKYIEYHCKKLQNPKVYEEFNSLVSRFNQRVKALTLVSYDLNNSVWNCRK